MTNSEDRRNERYDELVEQYRRHLRGQGRAPDLTAVDPDMRAELDETFALLEAITGMSDELVPPLVDDRAAATLGFTRSVSETPDHDTRHDDRAVEVVTALSELTGPDATLTEGEDPRSRGSAGGLLPAVAVYRRWGVVVRVCLTDTDASLVGSEEELRRAGQVFDLHPDTNVVALVANDHELTSVLVGPGDCRNALDPTRGAVGPTIGLMTLPLSMAMRRHFEFTDPEWDDIPFGLAGTGRVDFSDATRDASQLAMASVKQQRTRMPEKKQAQESLGDRELEWLSSLSSRVLDRDLEPSNLARLIDELAEDLT